MYGPDDYIEQTPVLPAPCDCSEPCGWAHWRPSGVIVREDREGLHVQVPEHADVTVA